MNDVLYLGMRVPSADLVFIATFSATLERATRVRLGVLELAQTARSRRAFLEGLDQIARTEGFVLELGPVEHDQLAFYMWDPASEQPASGSPGELATY